MTKHKQWLELQSLQRQQHTAMLHGISDKQLNQKIDGLKEQIRREALRQEDNLSELELANRKSLVELMHRHNIVINARDFVNWRPVKPELGDISGVAEGVTCICTNGLLGYFITIDEQILCGHIDWFMDGNGEPITLKPLHSFSHGSGSNGSKPRSKRPQTLEEKTRALLIKLQEEAKKGQKV